MKNIYILILALISSFVINAQSPFNKIYGDSICDDNIRSILAIDSNTYLLNFNSVFNEGEELLSKAIFVDSDGNIKRIINNPTEIAYVQEYKKYVFNSYLGIGSSYHDYIKERNILLYLFDTVGIRILKQYPLSYDVFPENIIVTDDNGFLFTGSQYRTLEIFRTDYSGDTLWTKSLREPFGTPIALVKETDSIYIVLGDIRNGVGLYALWVNLNGDTLKSKFFEVGGYFNARCVAVTNSLDFIFARTYIDRSDSLYIYRLDRDFNLKWKKSYFEGPAKFFKSIKCTSDTGFILVGNTSPSGSCLYGEIIYIMKLDSQGDTLWTKSIGTCTGDEAAYDVVQTHDGGYIVVGRTRDGKIKDRYRAFFLKLDSKGDIVLSYGLNKNIEKVELSIFPNPVVEYLKLNIQENKSIKSLEIKIFDISGKLVLCQSVKSSDRKINVSQLKSGAYLIQIVSEREIIAIEKFIKK